MTLREDSSREIAVKLNNYMAIHNIVINVKLITPGVTTGLGCTKQPVHPLSVIFFLPTFLITLEPRLDCQGDSASHFLYPALSSGTPSPRHLIPLYTSMNIRESKYP